jgi:hypothetical protein
VAGQDVPENHATGRNVSRVTYIRQAPEAIRLWNAAYETEEAHLLLDELCPRIDGDGELLSLAARIAMALDQGEPDA